MFNKTTQAIVEQEILIRSIIEALGEAGLTKVIRLPSSDPCSFFIHDDPGYDYTAYIVDGQIKLDILIPTNKRLPSELYDLADPEVFSKITKRIRHWE